MVRVRSHDPHRVMTAYPPQITADTLREPREGPLRILAWVDRYPPYRGFMAGGEWALHHMLTPLAAAGHTVDVCTPLGDGAPRVELEGVGVHGEDAVPGLLDRCDVLISHLLWTKHAVHAAAEGGTPLVYLFHNDFTIPHWHQSLSTPRNVTAVVYNTRWLRASIIDQHPSWAEVPWAVVRPPVPIGAYHVETPPGYDREYVTLVNPILAKGGVIFYRLAEARPHLRFLAVEGGYGQQMRPRRKHQNVTWQPQTPNMRDDVYARSRVVIVPSEYESFGRVAVEAAASGAVVVCSTTSGLKEAMGAAGLYADHRDTDAWVHWIDALTDREVYETAQRHQAARAVELAAESAPEVAGFERLLRLAANAEPVPSSGMAPAHDPFRSPRPTRPFSVDVSETAQRPAGGPEAPDSTETTDPTATETQRLAEGSVMNPRVMEMGATLDDAAAMAPVVVAGLPADVVGNTTTDPQAFVENFVAAVEVNTDTLEGGGGDGGSADGDAGDVPEAPVSEGVDTSDGPGGQDAGQLPPEPPPLEAGAPQAPATEGGAPVPVSSSAAPVTPPDLSPAAAALIADVPTIATKVGPWIDAADTGGQRYDRAEAAEYVERRRDGRPRKTVIAVVSPILYEDEDGNGLTS